MYFETYYYASESGAKLHFEMARRQWDDKYAYTCMWIAIELIDVCIFN